MVAIREKRLESPSVNPLSALRWCAFARRQDRCRKRRRVGLPKLKCESGRMRPETQTGTRRHAIVTSLLSSTETRTILTSLVHLLHHPPPCADHDGDVVSSFREVNDAITSQISQGSCSPLGIGDFDSKFACSGLGERRGPNDLRTFRSARVWRRCRRVRR